MERASQPAERARPVFRATILDIPLLLFLFSQIISTIFSIDQNLSLFGYQSRLNGGLLSLIAYALLYWAYVANIETRDTRKVIRMLLISGVIVSIWGILEHFGVSLSCLVIRGEIGVGCWQQNVQERAFATLGQPNWLAAFIVALMPLAWHNAIFNFQFPISKKSAVIWILVSGLFFLGLLYTKSRSGFVGFVVASGVFWVILFIKQRKKAIKPFIILNSIFLILLLVVGSPFRDTRYEIDNTKYEGGTESGNIRAIVWKGAIDVWKHYPIVGSGVETFAWSYYQFKPIEHNLTSEWDYLYNKAHNEYLNLLANTGILGLGSYLMLILFSTLQISNAKFLISKQIPNTKNKKLKIENHKLYTIDYALLAGYVGILVTNFFGFSVVVTNLLLFLFPAMTVQSAQRIVHRKIKLKPIFVVFALCTMTFALASICGYWYSDFLYTASLQKYYEGDHHESLLLIKQALIFRPRNGTYYMQAAKTVAKVSPEQADEISQYAIELSPRNIELRKERTNILDELGEVDKIYYQKSLENLRELELLAPKDVRVKLNIGLNCLELANVDCAKDAFRQVLLLKPDYEAIDDAIKAIDDII